MIGPTGRVIAKESLDVLIEVPVVGADQHGMIDRARRKLSFQVEICRECPRVDMGVPHIAHKVAVGFVESVGAVEKLPGRVMFQPGNCAPTPLLGGDEGRRGVRR